MPTYGAVFSDRDLVALYLDITENENLAANTSTISWTLRMVSTSPNRSYDNGNSNTTPYSVTINGSSVASGQIGYNFGTSSAQADADGTPRPTYGINRTPTIASGTTGAIAHDSNGSKSIAVAGSYSPGYPIGSASISATVALKDYVRVPQSPAVNGVATGPTVDRTVGGGTGTSLTLTSAVAPLATGSPAAPAITQYEYQQSLTGTFGGTGTSMGTSGSTPLLSTTVSGLTPSSTYYYQTRAVNSEGNGPWSPTTIAYPKPIFVTVNVPAQGFIGQSYSGSVTASTTTSFTRDSGTLPPGASLSTSGTLSGSPTTAGIYSFVIAANGPGGKTLTSTQTVLIGPSGPLVKTASAYARTTIYVWTGSAWKQAVMRAYNTNRIAGDGTFWNPIL